MNFYERIKHIPLYRDICSTRKEGDSEETWLATLPPLEKKSLVKNFPVNLMTPELKQAIEDNQVEYNSTSGTTEERLQIIRKLNWWDEEEKRIAPYTGLWGQNLHDPSYSRAVLTTPMCSNTSCFRDNPSYETRIIGKKLYLNTAASPDVWSVGDIQRMVAEIDRFRPMHVHADPVYLAIFIHLIDRYHLDRPTWTPQFLTLCFEFAPAVCRNFIRSFWNVPTFSVYGLTELGYLFCECENGRLHWCEPLNTLHFIPIKNKETVFNLAVTSLKNEYMPFIKYFTNDLFLVNPTKEPRCQCQHPSPFSVDKILGRQKDLTWTAQGEPLTVGEIDQVIASLEIPILLYQIDFSIPDQLFFKYMSTNSQQLSSPQKDLLRTTLETTYGNSRAVKLIHVPSLKPATSGKFIIIKQS